MVWATIVGIYTCFMEKGGISKVIWTYEIIGNQYIHWRSITVLLVNMALFHSSPYPTWDYYTPKDVY